MKKWNCKAILYIFGKKNIIMGTHLDFRQENDIRMTKLLQR